MGLVITIFGLFGLASVLWNESKPQPRLRKIWMVAHGIGLLLLFVAGFGLAARMGFAAALPKWVYAKIIIWLFVGGLIALIKRKPQKAGLWILSLFLLLTTAIILAVMKPF